MSYSDVFGSKTIPVTDEGYVAHNITASDTLVWPDKYDGTNLLAANIVDLTTTAGLTVTFPPANQASTGQSLIVRNIGANSVELLDADRGSIAVVASGEVRILFVSDNSSAAGTWAVFTLGTGTSAADASALASYGLKALSGKLAADHPYIEKSGNYTVQASDRAKVINVTSGTVAIGLPQASAVTAGFFVLIRNSAIGTITVDPFNTELVNGELTFDLNPAESALFVCSGSGWYTVGYGRDVQFAFSEFVVDAAAGSVALSSSDVAGRMIRVGGTAAGNIVVTLPAIDNIYFVNVENGMGAFNVTFTTGAGTTVVLNANSRTAIYSDGTNVTAAITTALTSTIALDDGSASTPTLSFVLDTDTGLFRRGDNELGIAAGGNEIAYFSPLGLTLNSTYNLLIGHDSLSAVLDGVATPALQVHGATASTTSLLAARWSADINGSFYSFSKSRSGVVGTHTIVQSGDQLGRLEFTGSDGVKFIGGARIVADVDGTPGLDDMPGRLVFSTTADGASTPTERMRISSTGLMTLTGMQVINANSASDALRITQTGAGNALVVEDSANPDSTPFVVDSSGNIIKGHTSAIAVPNYAGSSIVPGIQATALTIAGSAISSVGWFTGAGNSPNIVMARSNGTSIGDYTAVVASSTLGNLSFAGSDGTNFVAAAAIAAQVDGTPGLNDMPARLVFSTTADGSNTPTERLRIDSSGQVGIGGTTTAGTNLLMLKNLTGAVTSIAYQMLSVVQSDVTSIAISYNSAPSTVAAAFTLDKLYHFRANQNTKGAGSAITNQYGYAAESSITGATNNYGFYSDIAAGTNRWNFYANGTALNFFNGGIEIGRTGVTAPASTDGNVFSGSYTPTITNGTNVASSTATVNRYTRVGNQVTVHGTITVTFTAANTNSTFRISLPVTTNFGSVTQGHLTGSSYTLSNRDVLSGYANATTEDIDVRCYPSAATAITFNYIMMYEVA